MELVGEKYHVGAGTVEKIYRDFQNAQPEYKKRETPAGRIVESLPRTVSHKFISGILTALFSRERCVCSYPTMKFV